MVANLQECLIGFIKEYKNTVNQIADELRNQPMPELTDDLFSLFEKSGNRIKYEAVYFKRRKYIATFGLLSIMDGRAEDIHMLEGIILDICREECWALPAHVNREKDNNWRNTIDLFACETAQTLAEIITLLDTKLGSNVIETARNEVFRRVLDPFYQSRIGHYNWEVCTNNWCAVCSGSIGSASIYLMKDQPERLNQSLDRIANSLTHYIEGFTDDGTCEEGLGYFTYGMTYYIGFATQLYDYTQGKQDILNNEKCARIAAFQQKCYFIDGITIPFSDSNSDEHYKVGLTCYLAMRYPDVTIPNIDKAAGFEYDSCYRWMSIYRDYIWTEAFIKKLDTGIIQSDKTSGNPVSNKGQVILPIAQWSMCNSKNGAGMGAKGGNNSESHNHNDIGSFFYLYGKDMLLADLGAGEYTKDYFGSKRYEILCNSSLGHNVPLINGHTQLAGKDYYCDKFEADGNGRTKISYASAYEEGLIASIDRTLDFDEDSGVLIVEDQFVCSRQTEQITENLVTKWKPEIKGNQIIIQGPSKACRITISNLDTEISCLTKTHNDHAGNEITIYLIQWVLCIDDAIAYSKIEIEPLVLR